MSPEDLATHTDFPSQTGYQNAPVASSPSAVADMPAIPDQLVPALASTPTPPVEQRQPVVIPSTGKKSPGTMRPPKRRSTLLNASIALVLVVIVAGLLAVAIPAGNGQASGMLSFFQPQVNSVTSEKKDTALISAQAATATAVMQDGYDAGGAVTYAGVNRDYSLDNGQSTLDIATGGSQSPTTASAGGKVSAANLVIRATPGQCTYWADYRYWQLTGYDVPWAGNAATYAYQAPAYGWINTTTPVLHSIIVLQPGVQHAGAYTGHVGIVEAINADGSVYVSSWNIVGPGILSYTTYYPGAGVSFVYHP